MLMKEKAETVYSRLRAAYGTPVWSGCTDSVDELIGTMLSANTNDINSARAFDQLKQRFGDDWQCWR